jgi:dynein heavy chain 1
LGDVLISAAFLTYIGFFGQFYRELLISTWKEYLVKSKIDFRKDISLVEFLSVPSERILWQRKGLPSDVLAT